MSARHLEQGGGRHAEARAVVPAGVGVSEAIGLALGEEDHLGGIGQRALPSPGAEEGARAGEDHGVLGGDFLRAVTVGRDATGEVHHAERGLVPEHGAGEHGPAAYSGSTPRPSPTRLV